MSLRAAPRWSTDRVAELHQPVRAGGVQRGKPGPDQGYALRLVRRVADRLLLTPGEHREDVIWGVAMLASRRAAMRGRAPTGSDVDAVLALWALCDEQAPAGLVALRRRAFSSVAHEYHAQRALADRVPGEVLALEPEEITPRLAEWASLVGSAP